MSLNKLRLRKDRRWISSIHSEEFQRVGTQIFIKSKMLLFPYTLIIPTQIFKIFFNQGIILFRMSGEFYRDMDKGAGFLPSTAPEH